MGKTSILRNINSHLGSEVRLAYVNLLILGGAERGLSDLFLAIADEIRASLPELPQADMDEFDRHPELAFKQYLDLVQSALGKSRLIIALDEFEKLEEWMRSRGLKFEMVSATDVHTGDDAVDFDLPEEEHDFIAAVKERSQ